MLAELWAWLTTPCSPAARRLGYLHETIALSARHRRCRTAWQTHLQHSRNALLAATAACKQHRGALILGSGDLLDVPLADLARRFQTVTLVDVLHPPSVKRQARRHANVRWLEHDVTECLADVLALPAGSHADTIAALGLKQPGRFLPEADIDFVASVNLLSQLPLLPCQWLLKRFPQYPESLFDQLALALMQRHIEYLRRFDAPVCLIADAEQISRDRAGNVLAHTDFIPALFAGMNPAAEWWWDIAPDGEAGPGCNSRHRVWALEWRNARPDG
ncbi:MAG: hypothetical protein EPN21_16135 [Methylococcaceae bacterium]|nr:MAG: hypothetical protein EPN21_16135 [Methylococcaceae bacterium]